MPIAVPRRGWGPCRGTVAAPSAPVLSRPWLGRVTDEVGDGLAEGAGVLFAQVDYIVGSVEAEGEVSVALPPSRSSVRVTDFCCTIVVPPGKCCRQRTDGAGAGRRMTRPGESPRRG